MILITFYYILFIQILVVGSSDISKKCVCGHVRNEKACKNSGFCIWSNDQCILNLSQSYNTETNNLNSCKSYSQEDCRELEQCCFYFGKCIDFTDCSIFDKDNCQKSSYQCVSDGVKCVRKQECSDYKTEIGCGNKNKKGKYCFWIIGIEKKCTNVTQCEELPINLNNHNMCKDGLDGCTISEKGYGCIKQMELCSQYLNNFQCFQSQSKIKNCFWDSKNDRCVEKVCENLLFTQDYECRSYLSDYLRLNCMYYTTNGIHCVKRKQCSDAQNKFGCVTDAQDNKCEYHQNQCKIKSCNTAPDSLNNYQQCQDYDNLLDCYTSENKGCKNRPETCNGYVNQIDCYSIEQQDCVWYQNKCEQRQCHHAPIYFNNSDCHQYGNCISKLIGGCQDTPQLCEEILEEQFCQLNYNKERCIWLEDQNCNKLKLPYYKNHQICQNASQYCTFNLLSFGCTDYICENILELEYCKIDSGGDFCTMNQGCIEKKCDTAPLSYDSNQKCEEWMSKCTVNVLLISTSIILIGCVDKKFSCELSSQDQCSVTIQGYKCKWDGVNQRCIDQDCTDADLNLYLQNDDCKAFQVFVGPCIIGSSGVGCSKWPTNCDQMISQLQCQLNLQDGTKCFWTDEQFNYKQQQCSDAPKLEYTNNVKCNTWLNNCIFDHSHGGCQDRPNQIDCTYSPNYGTHQECNAWNPKCTISAEVCQQKKSNCNEFINQANCKTTINGQICYWDDQEKMCKKEDNDNNGIPDCHKRAIIHNDCEEFMPKCTINYIVKSCINLSSSCNYIYKQQCIITLYQQLCKWDNINKICKEVVCIDNTTAQTEAECFQFSQFNKCQLKINSDGTYGPGCENRPTFCLGIIIKFHLFQLYRFCQMYINSNIV